jgi:transketolase N-terminal domain/subunit
MADFYKDKEMTTIIALCSSIDRRKHLLEEIKDIERSIIYQVERTDKGMSAMSRAEVITMLYSKYMDMKHEDEWLKEQIAKLQKGVALFCADEGDE